MLKIILPIKLEEEENLKIRYILRISLKRGRFLICKDEIYVKLIIQIFKCII